MTDIGTALELAGVSKRYPGTLAVDGVDLAVRAGEVHALVGENGAGKSTLMKIIAGSFADYTGEIRLSGKPVRLDSPSAARAAGVAMIYQELSLAPPVSVAENILAGRLPACRGVVDRKAMRMEARRCLALVGLEDLDPATPAEDLSQHEAQLVEIAKALGAGPCILVMDEPTSTLSRQEVARLFEIIRRLRRRGIAIIYISHHLSEVFEVADRVTVLRDGRKVATCDVAEVTKERLVEMMVGGAVSDLYAERARRPGRVRLEVRGLDRWGFFHDASFHVREGEILGIGGLAGAGRSELARSLCGIDPRDAGRVLLDGRDVTPASAADAIGAGLVYLTEDRKAEGLALRLSAAENLLAAVIPRYCRFGLYRGGPGAGLVRGLMARLQIQPREPRREAATFSGGNQQKVLLGKWLATSPEVLVLDEPTRGVDVGAKVVIHRAIAEAADRGACVLLVSSDLPELVGLSDRVLIMRAGHLIGEMAGQACTEQAVLLAANGEGPLVRP